MTASANLCDYVDELGVFREDDWHELVRRVWLLPAEPPVCDSFVRTDAVPHVVDLVGAVLSNADLDPALLTADRPTRKQASSLAKVLDNIGRRYRGDVKVLFEECLGYDEVIVDPSVLLEHRHCAPMWMEHAVLGAHGLGLVSLPGDNKYPALPDIIYEDLAGVLAGNLVVADGPHGVELRREDRILAYLRPPPWKSGGPREPAESARHLGTVAAHRLLRFLVFTAWRAGRCDEQDPERVRFEGGFDEIARSVGLRGRWGATSTRQAAKAFEYLHFKVGRGYEPVLEIQEHRVGNKHHLDLILRGPLAPGYVHELRGRHPNRDLVPLPPELPLLTATGKRSHASATSFQMLLIRHAYKQHQDFRRTKTIRLPHDEIVIQGRRVGLDAAMSTRLFESWATDPVDPLLVPEDDEGVRYTFPPQRGLLAAHIQQRGVLGQRGRKRKTGAP